MLNPNIKPGDFGYELEQDIQNPKMNKCPKCGANAIQQTNDDLQAIILELRNKLKETKC